MRRHLEAWLSRPATPVVISVVAAVVVLGMSVGVQVPCVSHSVTATDLCFSDLRALFGLRQLGAHLVPYVHPGAFGLPKGTVEYPVLTVVFAWLTSVIGGDVVGFMVVSFVALGAAVVVATYLSAREVGYRALLVAASPTLLLHAYRNWDVLAVLATIVGIVAWRRGHGVIAAGVFAAGACLKLYPALFVLVLLAEAWSRHDVRGALRRGAAALGVVVALNLPVLLVAPGGWRQVLDYQQQRPIDISAFSLWSTFGQALTIPLVNVLSLLALAAGTVVVLFAAGERATRTGAYPVVQCCAALTCVFLVTNKASSPQYILWLLPFFVFLEVRWPWWVATAVVDLLGTAVILLAIYQVTNSATQSLFSTLVPYAVVLRSALFLALAVVFLRSPATPGRQVSQQPTPASVPAPAHAL